MKILFALSASVIDNILSSRPDLEPLSYSETVRFLFNKSLFQSFGFDIEKKEHNLCIFNSRLLGQKWLDEKGITSPFSADAILKGKIEESQPDVIYSNNPEFFTKERFDKLPDVKHKVIWRAAPLFSPIDLSHFDLGLSYASIYLDLLNKHGLKNTALMQFHLHPDILNNIPGDGPAIDLSFCGSYHDMFHKRNKLLVKLAKKMGREYQLNYYLRAGTRFRGLLPAIPFSLWKYCSEPVFLEEYLNVIKRSKITFNHHSDFAGPHKGNMRIFETMGMKSFLLSDEGFYPEGMKAGYHFVSYNSEKDLIDKARYYLENSSEREEIAQNGYDLICGEYSLQNGSRKLNEVFETHL